jgi:ABC-type transport system involved in multi-copper enzyme maturation permease subunit
MWQAGRHVFEEGREVTPDIISTHGEKLISLWSPFSLFELPLLRRELLEASHKRRTYALRAIIAIIHVVGFLLYYFSVYSRRGSIRQFSGEGVAAVEIQVLIDLVAIVLLLPAMACSAISGEREKQTLGLLLISRIGPFALVIEKLLSRLLPMTTLLLITVPMLGVAFLLGGVELGNVLMILCLLLTAAIQVAAVAILCSSILNSALDAFWATYIVLAGMYFVPGIVLEMIGVPPIAIVQTLDSAQLQYFCMSYLLALGGLLRGTTTLTAAAISSLPPLSISAMMLIAASRYVVRTGSGNALETGRVASGFIAATWKTARRLIGWPLILAERLRDWFWANGHFLFLRRKSIAAIETNAPIAWREANSTLLTSWKFHFPLLCTTLFLQWWSFPEVIGRTHQAEAVCLIADAAVLLMGLMMIAGTGCRTFAAERSRETLDVLLTTPIRNGDLLNQKLSAVNRIRWFILSAILVTGLVHLFVVDMTYLYGRFPVRWQTSFDYIVRHRRNQAWGYLPVNLAYSLLHAFVYLTIMKWAAVLFSLMFRTQIKALMATLVTVIAVCALPFVGTMIPLVLQSIVPKQFPAFLFSSPLIIWGLNETGELSTLVPDVMNRRSGAVTSGLSEVQLVITNLCIYGVIALILKYGVILLLPRILGRRDTFVERG